MKTGDVIFVNGDNWLSKIIRKITNSPITHVALALDNKRIVEIYNGIYVKEMDYTVPYEVVSFGFNPSVEDLYKTCEPHFRDGYDYIYLFSLGIKYLLRGLVPAIDIDHKYTCVEFVVHVLDEYGYQIEAETPAQLYDTLTKTL